ncbi:MAG: hypothetical protein ACJAV6_000521 [Candidatus Paceibacteria bacterium]|jgi:hypothetical protein
MRIKIIKNKRNTDAEIARMKSNLLEMEFRLANSDLHAIGMDNQYLAISKYRNEIKRKKVL